MNCSATGRGAALVIVLSALGGCAKVGAVRLPPYPGRATSFDVARVSMRDAYLDVELENDRRFGRRMTFGRTLHQSRGGCGAAAESDLRLNPVPRSAAVCVAPAALNV